MVRNARARMLMLVAPPLVLLFWAHVVRPTFSGWDWSAVILAGLVALAGVAIGPWTGTRKWIVAVVYCLLLVPALPFAALLAVCSTGDCL